MDECMGCTNGNAEDFRTPSFAVDDDGYPHITPLPRLTVNRAKCLVCGDIIESKHTHDWASCSCKNIYVDGGLSYGRGGVRDGWDTVQDLCQYEPVKERS